MEEAIGDRKREVRAAQLFWMWGYCYWIFTFNRNIYMDVVLHKGET